MPVLSETRTFAGTQNLRHYSQGKGKGVKRKTIDWSTHWRVSGPQLPPPVEWASLLALWVITSVTKVWRESVDQLSTTPLSSVNQSKTWPRPCIEMRLAKKLCIGRGFEPWFQQRLSLSLSACLSVYPSLLSLFCSLLISLSDAPSLFSPFRCLPLSVSPNLSVFLPDCLFVCLFICLAACLFFCLSVLFLFNHFTGICTT